MRRFGIEVEAALQSGKSFADVQEALRAAGLGGSSVNYSAHSATHWVVKRDGSIMDGVEVVSPPLDFDNPEQRGQVDRAMEALRSVCRTDPRAGIHVHVESRDLDAQQVAAVARTFVHFEDVMFRLASSGWNTIRPGARTYCKPLSQSQVDGLSKARTTVALQRAYYGGTGNTFAASHGHSSRYCALNLHSHFYRGTIEFRLFNSSMNTKRVQTYIAVAVALVEDARRGHKRSVNRAVRLGAMASGQADAARVFFRFLTVVRYEAGMSLEDYRNLKAIWKGSRAQRNFMTAAI